jgi:hypothetical protein
LSDQSDTGQSDADQTDRRRSGLGVLVLRAEFVPAGYPPPPEFAADFRPLKFSATRDPATGEITCDNAGISFGGDLRAEWHPDQEEEPAEEGDAVNTGGLRPGG